MAASFNPFKVIKKFDRDQPIDYWMGMRPEKICIQCNELRLESELFKSRKCTGPDHHYCAQCVSLLIYQSLSLLNQIPTCIQCDKPLYIVQNVKSNISLPAPYQSVQNYTKRYETILNNAFLVQGYIRSNYSISLIPCELITMIHDYFHLVYHALIGCDSCNALGFRVTKCYLCLGRGYTECCTQCITGEIMRSESCPNCNGIGQCMIDMLCNVVNCEKCQGTGRLFHFSICSMCNGYWSEKRQCAQCDATGWIKRGQCDECSSKGYVLYTDFKKIVRKQKYCHNCGMFYPQNNIMYWSGCRHTFCDECIKMLDIMKLLHSDQIPMCMVKNCEKELKEKEMVLYWNNMNYVILSHLKYQSDDNLQIYVQKLRVLNFRKGKFECSICGKWHCDKDKLLFSHCGHEVTKKCAVHYIRTTLERRYIPQCPSCKRDIETDDVEIICGAQYVHVVEALRLNLKLKALIVQKRFTRVTEENVSKVLKLRKDNLFFNDVNLKDKVVDFLSLTSIKVEDMEYIQVIVSKSKIALFQLCFKEAAKAKNIAVEIGDLIEKNILYREWHWGFWQIYDNRSKYKKYNDHMMRTWNNRHQLDKYHRAQRNAKYGHYNNTSIRRGVFVESKGRLATNRYNKRNW